jgi:hypothetical protein
VRVAESKGQCAADPDREGRIENLSSTEGLAMVYLLCADGRREIVTQRTGQISVKAHGPQMAL